MVDRPKRIKKYTFVNENASVWSSLLDLLKELLNSEIENDLFSFSLQKLVDHIVELLDELKYEAEDILLENT